MNKIIKNFITKEELDIFQKYCYNKLDSNKDYRIDNQSFSPAWYSDSLMTALLDVKLPIVEKESKLKLFPTYAYWRYYVYGGSLAKHTDRPSCGMAQVFLHYVNQNGPYKNHAYDQILKNNEF